MSEMSEKMKVVDESMADQRDSLKVANSVANHKQQPVDDDRIKPIGDKAMQGGKYN